MESRTLEEFQQKSREALNENGKDHKNGHKPEQPEIPGTEHVPTAIELKIRPFAIKAAVARKRYQAAGRLAKEVVDQLEAVIEMQGMKGKLCNCGGGVVVRPEITEKIAIEIPEGMEEWEDPSQPALDGTERDEEE